MYGWRLQQKANSIPLRIPGASRLLFAGAAKLLSLSLSRARVFQLAYATRVWGSAESGSGIGSELAATENVSAYLPELFQRLQVSKFLDAPCGDWNWMRRVDLSGVDYFGGDVVSSVVTKEQTGIRPSGCTIYPRGSH
jgi:hypothetical protein